MTAPDPTLSIGEVVERTGVSHSALRFYERHGLLHPERTEGGQRRFRRSDLRRIAFVKVAQRVGLTLEDTKQALAALPDDRAPSRRDWERISRRWQPLLDERIRILEGLRDRLGSCIGCGCLSLTTCALYNPDDRAAGLGAGPRYLLGDEPAVDQGSAGDADG